VWLEKRIRRLARDQHGVVSRAQLLATGVSEHEIAHRLRTDRMTQRYPGVYYLDSTPITWFSDVRAALFACGEEAVASHRSAAMLWQLDGLSSRMIEATVPYLDSPEPTDIAVHRTRRPNSRDTVNSIAVTGVEKTILDLASILPGRMLHKAARSAVRKGLTTVESLDQAVGRFGGRGVTGTRLARRIIAVVADDESGSTAEIDFSEIVFEAPVPRPVAQLRIGLSDGSNAYPDFAWPDRKRIVEVDGFQAHGTPDQLQHDLRRQNQLLDLGWEIRRFTATEVRERPQRVRNELVAFVNKPFCES
jgi:Transcriptional regulator, AbiEi antitoxin/Protein of unknown function (DUF559)